MNEWQLNADGSYKLDASGNKIPNNTCAIRMSYALNKSGLKITSGTGVTVTGADGSLYFLRVADLQVFLAASLGTAQTLAGGAYVGPPNQSGILSFNVAGFRDATGHFTLWNGNSLIDISDDDYDDWPAPTNALFWGVQ